MTQMDPETSKNQIGMLKTFEINDSKPNWQKKIPIPKMYNSPLSVKLKWFWKLKVNNTASAHNIPFKSKNFSTILVNDITQIDSWI